MRRDDLGLIGIILFVLFLFGAGIWWKWYTYQDCRKVGHTVLYCLGRAMGD